MELMCDIIQDLLPLYEEELCTPGSRVAVEEHLRTCPGCRAQRERLRAIPIPEAPQAVPGEDRAAARSLRRVRRRWWVSLAAVLLAVPMVLLTVNQLRGQGLCFTNLDEAALTAIYLNRLQSGNYEAAADLLDYEEMYDSIQQALSMSVRDHTKTFEPVTLGGETWYRGVDLDAQLLEQEDPWAWLVYNRVSGVMVPEGEFERVMALEPDNGYTFDCWTPLRTQWGTYYVETGIYREEYETAADYCFGFFLVPEAIYLEGKQALEENGREVWQSVWDYYGGAADMTLEEFTEYVRADYLRRQETAPQWTAAGFSEGCFIRESGHWIIQWSLKAEGRLLRVEFAVEDGRLRQVASSSPHWEPEMDSIVEALDLRWPH